MSTLGGAFGTLANGWVLFELTGSETALSTLWILYFLPSLVVQLAAGPYLDRWRRTRILFWSHGLRGMLFLFPAALWWAGALEPWHLYGVSAVSGVIQAVYAPASLAAIPSVVPSMLLQGANARLDGTFRLLSMLGPVIGGGVVAAWGPTLTWAAVVCSFLGGASLLAGIKEERPPRQPQGTTWVKQFQEEIDVFCNQSIFWVLAHFLAVVQLGVGVLMVLGLPFVSRELEGGAAAYGWFAAGFPLGYALGSLLLSRMGPPVHLQRVMLGANLLGGLTFVGLSLAGNIGIAVVLEIIAGMSAPFFHVYSTTLFQKLVPPPDGSQGKKSPRWESG